MLLVVATLSSCGEKSSPTAPSTINLAGLTVVSTGPAPGATAVPVTSGFSVKFSAAISPATATGAFTLYEGSNPVPGRVTTADSTVTFTPLLPLHTSRSYTATVSAGIKDLAGHALAASHSWSATTQAGQSLGGIMNASTTLNLAGSPYELTSDLQVAYGATLTIAPGVVIEGANRKIVVYGNLSAVGTANQPVTLHDVRVVPGGNTEVQPYSITIQYALVDGGRIYDATGNAVYGSLVIRDSKLLGLQSYMYVWYPVADCYIERNVFVGCGGISTGTSNAVKVYVRNNVFYQQTDTYSVQNWATYNTSGTIVALNSFLSTDRVALRLPAGYTDTQLTGTDNFWGTTSASTIAAMIFDQNDDLASAGVITFQPILTSPDAATPDPEPWISLVPQSRPLRPSVRRPA
jgi:hypothetical protein